MTATLTRSPAGVVTEAWSAYRASQQMPFSGDLQAAQSALFWALAPHADTYSKPWTGPDLPAIAAALDGLVTAMAPRKAAA